MNLLDYLSILRRRWPIVVAAVVVAVLGGLAVAPPENEVVEPSASFNARHTLFRDPAAATENSLGLPVIALFATRGEVPERVADRLGSAAEPAVLANGITVVPDDEVGTLTIAARDEDPERAEQVADAFAAELLAFLDERRAQRYDATVAQTAARVEQLEQRVRELDAALQAIPPELAESADAELIRSQRDVLIDEAGETSARLDRLRNAGVAESELVTLEVATAIPVEDDGGLQAPRSRTGRLAVAGLLGLLLGVGLVLVLERTDTRLRTRSDVEEAFGLPVVAEVPKLRYQDRRRRRVVTATRPASYFSEAYRVLRLSLQLMPRWVLPSPTPVPTDPASTTGAPARVGTDGAAATAPRRVSTQPVRVILVASATPGEGKTVTAVNLAASFAEIGQQVLVIDADIRRPSQHRYLGCERGPGLTEVLASSDDRSPSLGGVVKSTRIPGVLCVPGGSPFGNPGELLVQGEELIAAAKRIADIVVIDTGPLLTVHDAGRLLPAADAVVVVARAGQTTQEQARRTSELLGRFAAPVLGIALIGGSPASLGRRYPYFEERGDEPRLAEQEPDPEPTPEPQPEPEPTGDEFERSPERVEQRGS